MAKNQALTPIFNDIKGIIAALKAGEFTESGKDLVYTPDSVSYGRHRLDTGPFSSGVEAAMFLMPVLFFQGFRSVVTISGATHSPLSHPTGFVKESLLPVLERLGFYGSLSLNRFGFYGSGEGEFEMRIYPHEIRKVDGPPLHPVESIAAARIFMARMNVDLAARYRGLLSMILSLPEERISILEIRDAAGMGCAVQVYLEAGGQTHILYRDIPVYNDNGDLVFDEGDSRDLLDALAVEAKGLAGDRGVPDLLMAEAVPWLYLSGNPVEMPDNSPLVSASVEICEKILKG